MNTKTATDRCIQGFFPDQQQELLYFRFLNQLGIGVITNINLLNRIESVGVGIFSICKCLKNKRKLRGKSKDLSLTEQRSDYSISL
jgi:hypothetical protein